MKPFAELLDRLSYEQGRNNKLRLVTAYLAATPDPDRGYALAALTGALSFRHAKPALLRQLVMERVDPVLFALSYDHVGDLSETVALIWPGGGSNAATLRLAEVVETLATLGKTELPAQLARWLDELDDTGRWALLKLITGALRIGISARLAKAAAAALGSAGVQDVEQLWPGLVPPYLDLFAWLEGRAPKPHNADPAPFRPVMLAHALDESDLAGFEAADWVAEWKWDGIRVQAVAGRDDAGALIRRLYSRTGEDISAAFPDLVEQISVPGAVDGELLVVRNGAVQSFNTLQQRLNRKRITPALIAEFPAYLRAYDLLADETQDLHDLPLDERRTRLAAHIARMNSPAFDCSQQIDFSNWGDLAAARLDPVAGGMKKDAAAVEGVMLKRRDSLYVAGRPRGLWWKWKRDPHVVDAVLMYAQRGHGKRSSLYSDYTFGVWTGEGETAQLVPVGKAYFGFTDEELRRIDQFVRHNTIERFGPVRVVAHQPEHGLVMEIAFEGLQRSPRHKSGLAMRFPRINRLRWDKAPRDADRIEALEILLPAAEKKAPGKTATRRGTHRAGKAKDLKAKDTAEGEFS